MNLRLVFAGAFAISVLLGGCKPSASSNDATEPGAVGQSTNETPPDNGAGTQTPVTNQGGGGNIAPMGGMGAGAMTPVSGSESLQGGGSGVGQAAKDKAKQVAGSSPSSINGAASDDGGQ